MITFAERLRTKRLDKGYTQLELAHECGVSPATLQQWERGGRSPNVVFLQLLADALSCPLIDLLDCEFPRDHRMKAHA